MLTPPPSDSFGKWRRPRSSISANSKRQRPPEANGNANLDSNTRSDPVLRHGEVVIRKVNRLPPFVMAFVADDGDKGKKVSGLNLENVSHGQLQVLSVVPAENAALAMAGDQESLGLYVDTPPPIIEGRGVVKRFSNGRIHVVPTHADWFCPSTVHSFERQVVPHFFSGKSADHTTKKYIDLRNLIVAKYMEHPDKRLSINDCRGMDDSIDDEDTNRIFRFLEDWGIINYCAPVPDHESWNIDSYVREDMNGDVHVPLAALQSIDSLIKFDKPKCRLKAGDVYSSLSSNVDDISDLENRIQEKLSEHQCNYCLQPLILVYYQSVKEGDVVLCLDCYNEGRFVIGHSSMDFVRVDSSEDHGDLDADGWTDCETVLLLEAVEIYKDNWHKIAKHVGSKSKAQCILHFLRLPVEDGLLSNLDVALSPSASNMPSKDGTGGSHLNSYGHSAGGAVEDYDSCNRIPFIESENPVIALVAFLASSVAPRVAAACAQASLAALSEENSTVSEDVSHGEKRNSGREGDENVSTEAFWNSNNAEVTPLSAEKVKSAAKAGLVASAIKAKLLADEEEREIQRQAAYITSIQLKRLELKLMQFNDIEALLYQQCEQYDKTRQKFATERAIYMSSRFSPTGFPSTMNPNLTNNMPMQMMSASPFLQQSNFGFGTQMNHPNMPFMQQPAFSYGHHLPQSAFQPSSSSYSPNVMFNAQGTGQPSYMHPMFRPIPGTSSSLG